MNQFTKSFDGTSIYFESSGQGETAILFVHGWLGNCRWWDAQRDTFSQKFQIVQMDLAGHGKSSIQRKQWSVRAYAEDIKAVIEKLGLSKVILVGHSMSGSNVVEAYHLMPHRIPMIIFVDTLHDLEHMPTTEEVAPFFESMKKDFKGTIEASFQRFSFAKTSPEEVMKQLISEMGSANSNLAISSLEPFYATEIRDTCSRIKIPVRAINSDLFPTNENANRKYFSDFAFELISGVGHYPMLESPRRFNEALEKIVTSVLED